MAEHLRDARSALRSSQVTLSVVIIAKNEAHRIRRCLDSIRWAEEIIVVDGLSTDGTAEICRAYGARIIAHAFEGDFSLERNVGMEAAMGEWVLQLDADDVVTEEFRQRVTAILAHDDPAVDAYKFRRKSVLLGRPMRYGGWLYYIPNLVRRRTVRFTGRVHERPVIPGKIGVLEADIEHHPFQTVREFIVRQQRYTALQAQELLEQAGPLAWWRIAWRSLRRPLKTFWKSYLKKQGCREGWRGLQFAALYAWVEWRKWRTYASLLKGRERGRALHRHQRRARRSPSG